MTISLWVFLLSALALLLFVILFNLESKKGQRIFLSRFRSYFDDLIIKSKLWQVKTGVHFSSGSVRILLHFVLHKLLNVILNLLRYFETALSHLQRRNRNLAKAVRVAEEKTHLDLIAEHKDSVALSPEDKELLKRRSIEGE